MGCGSDRNLGEICSENPLHLGIQGGMNGKVQWLETSDNKLNEAI